MQLLNSDYIYGTSIHNLPTTESKIFYGEQLLQALTRTRPMDKVRVARVAEMLNHNYKTLNGGI
jgi:hypothetical protein